MASMQPGTSPGQENNNSSPPNGASLDRIRQMLLTPPSSRPPEFENPLEKIEQLLTCPICLDRYKSPKLLPCHHTFCLPCLDSCADIIHRTLKCPECRAEHPLPYDGVKSFQTNYTLIGFLDVHLQATDENAAQLEAYIQRYNLERCKVCDEKAELDLCAHCDRRACTDCRSTHMEMLKRDLTRMLNQVKRLSNRITEASDGLSKGAELLSLNCETTKDEVKEYFRRYYRELKKREEMFLNEIDTFHSTETRLMRNLRDVLEIESSNMSEGCSFLEAGLKGERELTDAELAKFKNIFSEGLEYLRNFQPDADELFSKKLRFSPGDDASKLPSAIAGFGELTVMLPQFAGRYLPLEQSYLPRLMRIGYESDNYKLSNRRNDAEDARAQNESRPSRYSTRNDDDMMSIRYRRRQQMEEEAWNRLRVNNTDSGLPSPGSSHTPGNSPWSRTVVASGAVTPVESSNETRDNLVAAAAKVAECAAATRNAANPVEEQPKMLAVPSISQKKSEQEEDNNNNGSRGIPNALAATTSSLSSEISRPVNQSVLPKKDSDLQTAKASIKITRKPPLPRQASSEENSLNEKIESIRAAHEKRRLRNRAQTEIVAEQNRATAQSSDESESENEPAQPPVTNSTRFRIICRSASGTDVPKTIQSSTIQQIQQTPETNANSQTTVTETPPDTPALSIPVTHYPGEIPSWLLRRRHRFQRSKTNPDLMAALSAANLYNGGKATVPAVENNPSPNSSRVQQLLVERSNRLDSTLQRFIPPPPRQESTDASNTTDTDAPNNVLPDRRSRFRRRTSITNEHETPSDARISKMLACKIICTADYQSKSKPRLVFGKKGGKEGDLNWPRGIAPIGGNEFAVCDSSNHRICIFNTQGRLIRAFGKYGTGDGQLDSTAGICCNRFRQLIVSDRYNHRIVIFDCNGQFLSKFGGHGPSNGRFNNPWGVAVDDAGMIYVVDKDNHRVQIFDSNGQFVSKFGSMGPGPGQFHNPQFIAIHRRTQQLYVTDSSNHRVCVFDHNGNPIFQFGQEGFHDGQLKFPRGISVDEQGFIVVADSGNNRVQIFYPDGQFMHSFGNWGTGSGQLKGLEAVALIDNTIIVSDRENHRIQLF